MYQKRFFQKGDFVTEDKRKGSFMIYEGNDTSASTCYKRMSVICAYDPEKYKRGDDGIYRNVPELEVSSKNKKCITKIDTDREDYWYRLCTPLEKVRAIEILSQYGYEWDEENLSLIDTDTGEIISKIITPKNEYNGEIVKPITHHLKSLLKGCCVSANKTTYNNYNNYWDEYD